MNTHRCVARLRGVGLAIVAAALMACGEGSPTEVVAASPAGTTEPEVLVTDPHPPGEVTGCPRPCDLVSGVCGPYEELVTVVSGALAEFSPPNPETACVTRIQNNRRTMDVDLQLPSNLVTGERFRFDSQDYPAWMCPVPGPVFDPDQLVFTDDWNFRVTPDGRLIGKCIFHE